MCFQAEQLRQRNLSYWLFFKLLVNCFSDEEASHCFALHASNTSESSAIEISAVEIIALQCTIMQRGAVQYRAVHCSVEKLCAVQCSAVQWDKKEDISSKKSGALMTRLRQLLTLPQPWHHNYCKQSRSMENKDEAQNNGN